MEWVDDKPIFALDGNVELELAEVAANPRVSLTLFVPVFVRLEWGAGGRSLALVIAELDERRAKYILAPDERDYLQSELERDPETPRDIRTIAYCLPDAVNSDLWTVLHIGPPVELNLTELPISDPKPFPVANCGVAAVPIVAVIDDGIGFLNARFRATLTETRFKAVWIQSSNAPTGLSSVPSGMVLSAADINAMLTSGQEEVSEYASLNAVIFGPDTHKATNRHTGHGTHVLDIAAGANIAAAGASVPLLAVQLPPTAVGDTSGRRLDPHIALGLRWVVNQALIAVGDPGNGGAGVPLIVNLSLGALAGPQDGTGFLERMIADELARFRSFAPHTPIRIVVAYGNARRERLVAKTTLAASAEMSLDWRILPDDRTPSFLELRVRKGKGKRVAVTLDPPFGTAVLALPAFPPAGQMLTFSTAQGKIARVTSVAEKHFDLLQIAVAPTTRDDVGATAPAGIWALSVVNGTALPIEVSAKVQRDDTPDGYRRLGRQSWIDHISGWEWDEETMDWMAPAADCPITRRGTEVNFSGLRDPSVYFVASATPDLAVLQGGRASRYSAEGVADEDRVPILAALADDGQIVRGYRAAGVLSGSTARLSGTSMAAPMVVRRIVESLLAGRALVAHSTGPGPFVAEIAQLLQSTVPPLFPLSARIGVGVMER